MKLTTLALCAPLLAVPFASHAQQPSAPVPTQSQQPPAGTAPGAATGQSIPEKVAPVQSELDCGRWKVTASSIAAGSSTTDTRPGAPGTATDPNASRISAQDFISCAAMGDMLELESSKLASSMADSKSKTFANRMIKDHTATSNELKPIAQKLNVTIPTALDKAHADKLDKLKQAKGADFDKLYDEMQVEAHEGAVGMFETYSRNGEDAQLKAFAEKHLRALREHLKMAREQK